jgi:hypothetical protein
MILWLSGFSEMKANVDPRAKSNSVAIGAVKTCRAVGFQSGEPRNPEYVMTPFAFTIGLDPVERSSNML